MYKRGLILNEAFMEAIRDFDAEDFKECMLKTYDYAANDVEPNFKNAACKMAFNIYKPFIDSNNAKYAQKQKEFNQNYGGY